MVNLKVSDLMIKIYDKLILDGINIDFKAEKKTAIIGPNGCGKSTLLKAISGLNRQYKGEILIDGENILHLSRKKSSEENGNITTGSDNTNRFDGKRACELWQISLSFYV